MSRDISFAQAVAVLAYLTSGQPLGAPQAGTPAPSRQRGDDAEGRGGKRAHGVTPRQALEASGAKVNAEKITVFGLLVSEQGGKDTFTIDEVRPLFRQARETPPGNFNRDLSTAISMGLIVESETAGEYYIANKAENVLETGFDGLRGSRTNGRSRSSGGTARRPRKAVETPDAFVGIEVSPILPDVINYHKVRTKTDKFVWAVYAAKQLGVEAVGYAELSWLTDRLGSGIKQGDLTAYYRGNQQKGYVNKNLEDKIRVTPDGVSFVESMTEDSGK